MGVWQSLLEYVQRYRNEPSQSTIVPLSDLSKWIFYLQQNISKKYDLGRDVTRYLTEMRQKRWQIECYLDEWQGRLTLQQREKVHNFFVESRQILEMITFSEQSSIGSILRFNNLIDEKIRSLIRKIEQSSFVHDFSFLLDNPEPHHTPVNPLLQELMMLDVLRDNFEQKIIKMGLRALFALTFKARKLEDARGKSNVLRQKKQERIKWLTLNKQKLSEKEQVLQSLAENPVYVQYLQKKEFMGQKQAEQDLLHTEITTFFTPFNELLKSYIANENMVSLAQKYVESPIEAFVEDYGLGVQHILRHIKAQLQNDRYELLADEAQILNGLLYQMEKGKLEVLRSSLISFQQRKAPEIEIEKPHLITKIEELNYRCDHFKTQQQRILKDIAQLDEQIGMLYEFINGEINLFQNLVKINFNRQLHITT
jgi:hypothetical protein